MSRYGFLLHADFHMDTVDTVSATVVSSHFHLPCAYTLSLMIKQIAVISGPCLVVSWVHTHALLCGEALKPEVPNVQAYVLRGKTTTLPLTDTCNALPRPAAILTHKRIVINNEHQAHIIELRRKVPPCKLGIRQC